MASGMQLRAEIPEGQYTEASRRRGASKDRFREGVKRAPEAGGGCGRDQLVWHISVEEEAPGSLETAVTAEAISDSMTV